MVLDANKFDFKDGLYCEELSMLQGAIIGTGNGPLGHMPGTLTLENCPEPGMHRSFRLASKDRSGGDIAGWNYEELPGPNRGPKPLRILVIND